MASDSLRRRSSLGRRFERLEPRLAMTGVVLNEFLAINSSGLADQDGDRTDWIELRNTGVAAVDLAGWHLTDDPADLDKWAFPATNVPAGGYVTVFASGKNRAATGAELHANFALAGSGGYLALVMPDGVTVADAYAAYPPQVADVSYGRGTAAATSEALFGDDAPLRWLVPTNSSVDATWYGTSFVDATWGTGTTGVGFDANGGTDYSPYINVNLQGPMLGGATPLASAYLRIPFTVDDPAGLSSLTLRMRYDDGFAIYLNGALVPSARRNSTGPLGYLSVASGSHADNLAVSYEDVDLTASLPLLQTGPNVLAIHGMNRAANNGDFLIDPLLVAGRPGPSQVGFMARPTPSGANGPASLGIVADTKFSVDRGFYAAPFSVLITTETPGAEIRYTLDGSEPTATTGLIFNAASPPLITTTTTLRAAAFKTGFTPTNVDTQTYVFLHHVLQQTGAGLPPVTSWGYAGPDWAMDPEVVNHPLYAGSIKSDLQAVPTVSLVMPWSHWFGDATQGIYPTETEVEQKASMEFITADGSGKFQVDGGLEIQGGTSDDRWKIDKLSMRIKFQQQYGPTKLQAALFSSAYDDDPAAVQFDTLVLDAHLNYTWAYGGGASPTDQRSRAMFIQDAVVADLQNLAGGKAPHSRMVHLYLNGLYWGLYDLHERPDDAFAQSYLGGASDDYDVVKHHPNDVVAGVATAAANYAAMLTLVQQDLSVPANYAAAAAKVDVDDLIRYMLVNYYVGNDDWPHHNWYASFNRADPNGQWRYHSWDAEHVFKNVNYNAIQTPPDAGSPEDVHQRLMANPDYRLRLADAVQRLFYNGGLLTPGRAASVYQARMQEVDRAIVGESARWGDSRTTATEPPGAGGAYTRAHWLTTQNGLLANYFPQRTGVVLGQLSARGWLVPLGAPTFSHYGGTVAAGYPLTLAKPTGSPASATLYYTLDGSDPRLPGGAVSPTATMHAGAPIAITSGTRVRARIHDAAQAGVNNDWSAEIDATFLLETPFPLRIVELHYNPADTASVADAQNLEFLELLNTGSQAISLDGVRIAHFGDDGYAFPAGLSLAAGERIVAARNPAEFQRVYGAGMRISPTGYGTQNLSNGGERIALLGPLGETLQDFVYDDVTPWPTAADGGGRSLEIVNPLGDPADPANWRASAASGGSPGLSGDEPAVAGDFDADSDADGADFLAWQRGFGTPAPLGTRATGDADGDQDVDAADLALWKQGAAAGAALAAPASAAGSARLLAADEWLALEPPPAAASESTVRAEMGWQETAREWVLGSWTYQNYLIARRETPALLRAGFRPAAAGALRGPGSGLEGLPALTMERAAAFDERR